MDDATLESWIAAGTSSASPSPLSVLVWVKQQQAGGDGDSLYAGLAGLAEQGWIRAARASPAGAPCVAARYGADGVLPAVQLLWGSEKALEYRGCTDLRSVRTGIARLKRMHCSSCA